MKHTIDEHNVTTIYRNPVMLFKHKNELQCGCHLTLNNHKRLA